MMSRHDWAGFILGVLVAIGFVMSLMTLTSAWPMQLLPNGTIIDLGTNATIGGTSVDFILFNESLYIIPKVEAVYNITNVTNINYQNITNVTNVTYQNVTYTGNFTNYTTQNITWENYTNIFNGTGELVYTITEIQGILGTYVLGSTMDGYVTKNGLTSYVLKAELNNITTTGSYVGTGTFWTITILILLIIGVGAYVLFARE